MNHKLINIHAVTHKTTLSKTSIYRGIAERSFPQPKAIGPKRVAWLESEINNWIEQQIAKSGNENNIDVKSEW